ncbi:hypothetical protein BH18VER1_BH18VER1_02260 [soil metagenome]
MRRYIPFIIIGVVILATAAAGTMIYRVKHERILALAAQTAKDSMGGKAGAAPAHMRGTKGAVVAIEEFADFQCQPCAGVAGLIYNLEQDYPGKLRLVFRQYPLDMHKHARLAALGAEAAGFQGKFWDMHTQLFSKQNEWAKAEDFRPVLIDYARTMGLDVARFTKDLESEQTERRLKLDRERATSLGVTSTPTLFINGEAVPPESRSPDGLRAAIQKSIDGKKAEEFAGKKRRSIGRGSESLARKGCAHSLHDRCAARASWARRCDIPDGESPGWGDGHLHRRCRLFRCAQQLIRKGWAGSAGGVWCACLPRGV